MRRTYRSKKETTGAIDPRDVLLTMDAKSSVFDAFYIQNIKQNKRDMSVGSAMHFVASNKVRKRKYVKRLKEQDVTNKPRESNSNTAFLTPDKSFRVKKAPDLFDQLLNSSNNTSEPINTFNKPSMQTRTYVKTQPNRKKINYSNNDSTDSDKENSSTVADETANSSDIRSHKLLIEKEIKSSQKCTDKSINDIANNLSIFSNLKNQTATPRNKNCLLHQPLQTSPLCSTPFLEKYRGASIYRFSPISINLDDSPKNVIINSNEDKTNINNTDENKNTYKADNQYPEATNIKENKESHSISDDISNNFQSDITNTSINKTQFKSTNSTIIIESPILPNKTVTKRNPIKSSCLQTTEMESFHGFGNSDLLDNNHLDAICDKYKEFENILGVDSHDVDGQSLDSIHIDNIDSTVENTKSSSTNSNISYFESESESCYDTCNSDDFDDMEQNWEPVVLVERLNDSVFNKYYDLMPKCTENEDLDSTNFSDNNDYDLMPKCTENEDLDSTNFSDNNDYDLMPKCTENEDLDSTNFSDNNDYASSTVSESVSDSCSTNADISNFSVTDDNSLNDDNESIYSNEIDSDNPKSPEDVCLNFVTTRRRVIPNDSILLDNTITSSNSSDVDKTVLNKKSLEDNFLVNNLGTLNKEEINLEEVGVKSKSFDNKETNQIEATLEIQRRITRKSARLSLKTKSQLPVNIPTVENNSHNVQTRKSSRISTSVANYEQKKHSEFNNIASKAIESANNSISNEKPGIVLQPGKRWERSLSIYRRMTTMADHFDETILDEELLQNKGRKYRQSVIMTMEMQGQGSLHNDSIKSRRSTFFSKPSRSTIKTIRESNPSRDSLCSTICEDLQGFLGEDCDDTIIELSKLSIADSEHEVTLIEKFHDTSNRIATARDYVLRRCNQTDVLLFDECYPDPLLKNCRKIGEGVYGEVFLWRAGDGRARVLKVIPIAGSIKVNGEQQKDFHEIISEIVIAMELSALRTPIADIEKHLNEGKSLETLDLHSVENATDVFNEVLSVRCVTGSYPSRLLDLWDLYDESRGSENDNPALLPTHQQYIVLELANAGQDLESYQFVNAEQSYALFKQIAFGLAVAEEACQFEHRDLHWGNVLISPTDQKTSHFVVRGRAYSLACCGVRASIIDYSLSRATVGRGALYSDLAHDEALFDALGDYQFTVYRLMRDKLGNDWKNFEPYTNILWLHYTVDKMITALRYTRTNSKIHKHYIAKLKEVKNRILDYGSAVQFVLTDNEL